MGQLQSPSARVTWLKNRYWTWPEMKLASKAKTVRITLKKYRNYQWKCIANASIFYMERNTLVTGCMCRQGCICVIPLTAGHCQVYLPRAEKFMGPAWGPPGSSRPQMRPMNLAIRGHLYPQTAAGEDWNPLLSRLLLFLLNEQPAHGLLNRYVKLRVAHAPGMPGTFSPPPRVSDPDMHHGTCVTHVPWCMSYR